MHEAGYTLTDRNPDFVVLGETRTYSFEAITRAIRLIENGARFIATNPDVTGPSEDGPLPATGAVAAMITAATRQQPYFVGKPNPMMLRSALNRIDTGRRRRTLPLPSRARGELDRRRRGPGLTICADGVRRPGQKDSIVVGAGP